MVLVDVYGKEESLGPALIKFMKSKGYEKVGGHPDFSFEKGRRMQSSTYEEIAGTCNILIGALYNAKTQEWEVFARNGQQTVGGAMPFNTGTDLSGHGIAIKVSDDCQLGKIEPPTLPS